MDPDIPEIFIKFDRDGFRNFYLLDDATMITLAVFLHENVWIIVEKYPLHGDVRKIGKNFKWTINKHLECTFDNISKHFRDENSYMEDGTILAFCAWLNQQSITHRDLPNQINVRDMRHRMINYEM